MRSGIAMQKPGEKTIVVQTTAERECLSMALTAALRIALTSEALRDGDLERIVPLCDLLDELIPKEGEY